MKSKRVVIERPEMQSPLQRVTGWGVTFVFWVIWLYLWLPLISLFAWLVGIRLFREHMIDNGGYEVLFDIIGWYLLIILITSVALLGWARYNLMHFRGKGRRKSALPIDLAAHAHDFKVDPQRLLQWQTAKHLVIHHDGQGDIARVETANPAIDSTTK